MLSATFWHHNRFQLPKLERERIKCRLVLSECSDRSQVGAEPVCWAAPWGRWGRPSAYGHERVVVKGWIRSRHNWARWYCWRAFEVRRLLVADNQGWWWHWASACPLWALCLLLMPWPHSTQLEQCLRHSRLRCCLQLLCASWGVRSLRVSRFWGLSIPRLFQRRDFCGSSAVQRWGDWFGHSVTFPG